jgi:hypothetical protein
MKGMQLDLYVTVTVTIETTKQKKRCCFRERGKKKDE